MIPLILQIQEAALDSKASVTDALRKAKVACVKLGLTEFGKWVDLELNGYLGKSTEELPEYRKLQGRPEAYNPYHGWQPIIFQTAKLEKNLSSAPVGMTISAIEDSLRDANADGLFEFPYPPEIAKKMRQAMNWGDVNIRIRLGVPAVAEILNKVRNILLDWTIELEKKGVLGENLYQSLIIMH